MSEIDPDLLAAIAGILEKGVPVEDPEEPEKEELPDWPGDLEESQLEKIAK